MLKNRARGLLAAALTPVILAACGGGGSNPTGSTTPTATLGGGSTLAPAATISSAVNLVETAKAAPHSFDINGAPLLTLNTVPQNVKVTDWITDSGTNYYAESDPVYNTAQGLPANTMALKVDNVDPKNYPGTSFLWRLDRQLDLKAGQRYRVKVTYRATCNGANPCTKGAGSLLVQIFTPALVASGSGVIASSMRLTPTATVQTELVDFVYHPLDKMPTPAEPAFMRLAFEPNSTLYIDDLVISPVDADPDTPAADVMPAHASMNGSTTAVGLPIAGTMFGLHVNEWGAHNILPDLGASVVRFWGGSATSWDLIEPLQQGQYIWDIDAATAKDKKLDIYRAELNFANAVAYGKDVILELGQTPKWAATNPDLGCMAAPSGTCSNPNDIAAWKSYITTMITRFNNPAHYATNPDGRKPIRYVEVWNEANIFYSGTPQELAQLTCAAYDTVKALDSSIKVIAPSIAANDLNTLTRVLETNVKDAQGNTRLAWQCVDIIPVHLYSPELVVESHAPARAANAWLMMKKFEALQAKLGLTSGAKEVWNTEASINCDVYCPAGYNPSAAKLHGVFPRWFGTMWANGISNVDYFFVEGGFENWTRLMAPVESGATTTYSLTAAGESYKMTTQWFTGATLLANYRQVPGSAGEGADIHIQKMTLATGKTGYLVWSTDNDYTTVNAPASWKVLRVKRSDGTTQVLTQPTAAFALKAREPVLLTP